MENYPNINNYQIGIYVRESRDDNEENFETIETQRDLLLSFVEKSRFGNVCGIYMDDNVSGSGFERTGILRLKNDVKEGHIDMLVLKDLSRLGRNNAQTLLFLDYLEENGVRVITYDGKYDSQRDNDTVGIETWFNERYIRDISKKIRTNLRFKIEKGEYIGHAPFGYIKSIYYKNKLCVDEHRAPVVREIYRLYREGHGYSNIARILNEKGCAPPSGKNDIVDNDQQWNPVAIQRILCSRVYIGDTVQGISEKISFKSKKTRRLPVSKWVITRNTHEPIISEEDFEEVQRIRGEKRVTLGISKGRNNLFGGIIICGRCGRVMFARRRKNRPNGYICSSYSKKGKENCSSHHVGEKNLIEIITEDLLTLLEKNIDNEKLIKMLSRELSQNAETIDEIERIEQQILSKQKQQDILYADRLDNKISEQLFLRMNSNIENRISQLRHEFEKARNRQENMCQPEDIMKSFIEEIKKNGLSQSIINGIVETIAVYEPGDAIPEEFVKLLDTKSKKEINETGVVVICYKFAGD